MPLTALRLASAGNATVIANPASIENLAGSDPLRLGQRDGVDGGGHTTVVAEAGHGGRDGGKKRENLSRMHCRCSEANGTGRRYSGFEGTKVNREEDERRMNDTWSFAVMRMNQAFADSWAGALGYLCEVARP